MLSRTRKRIRSFLARKGYGEGAGEEGSSPAAPQEQPELSDVMQAALALPKRHTEGAKAGPSGT